MTNENKKFIRLNLIISIIFMIVVLLFTQMLIGAPLGSVPLGEEFVFDDNAFSVMAGNWSPETYSIEYRNVDGNYTIPVTYDLINMLANDYPCANEQFAVLTKDNVPIEVDIVYTSPEAMSVDIVGNVTEGSYVIHSHPLGTCGDFSKIDVLTFPSPRDLITESGEGIDDIIVVTKISNSTASVCRVTGFSGSPDFLDRFDAKVSGMFGYWGNGDDIYEMFEEGGIPYRLFTITVQENTIVVMGD